ncbi:capsular exopolysaccharide family [Muriicola jejuensis]|uniref:non-specific protein-tyrosine kinase n=1 Tax=Muriicola jejuensis TaxID=504488 RepID=A0A6P0UE35_9FLAO|nr:tyrosine-protein kinase [Muriicola jejuensis]NER11514.1 polysaccharide biosynthesis tyrosine autokinase [Muriicola jejuensis]SMP20196.1 capsular exopolysaccharide family [Muriicola jejuensis]
MKTESNSLGVQKNQLDYKEVIRPYTKHWIWFVIAFFIAIIAAFLYIRYATPMYAVRGKIQIIEDQNSASELSALKDLNVFTGGNAFVEDEIEILSSRSNMIEVVKKLGLNMSIIAKGNIHDAELYKRNVPFKLNFLVPDSLILRSRASYFIRISSESSFEFREKEDSPLKNFSFGTNVNTEIGDFVLLPNLPEPDMRGQVGREFQVNLFPIDRIAQAYKSNLTITVSDEKSDILSLYIEDPVEQKGIDIINTLIDTYNENAIEDKKQIADKTSSFINDRIQEIYGDLSTVDQTAQDFKSGRGIADVASQTSSNISISAQSQQELQEAQFQLNQAASMKDIVDSQQGFEPLPSNIGLSDPSITSTTATYNQLVNERKRLLRSSNEKNPVIVSLDEQLSGLRRSLQSSLGSMTNNLNMQVTNLSNRLSQVNARIYATPGNERALRDITRQQQTTESLYLYLLQKQVESEITFASAAPKSKVIDRAYGASPFPVSPQKIKVLLAFAILGLLIPFTIIYVKELLDNKVHNKLSLETYIGSIPVLAELPKLSSKENLLVKTSERSVMGESLRILRTNLDFIINSKSGNAKRGNVIFVTSTIPGEGKTLVSSNLAMIFAKANKKVLLIGADIRNPRIYQFYSGKNVDRLGKPTRDKSIVGLTDYLVDKTIGIGEIISPMLVHDQTVDVIYSGKIPPNPAELLMSERMKELLIEVPSEYDYVIVDTAPLMVVSDTLLISEYADQILYVVRADKTELKVLDFPLKLHAEGKLKGLSFVVNGVKESNLGYGGKYGYGYAEKRKKWWQFT